MTLTELITSNPDHPVHGTKAAYDRHKCRCDRCRMANTNYMRSYRRKKAHMAFATITGVVDFAKRGGKGYTVIESWQVQGQDRKRRWAVWFEEETPLELQSTVTLSGVLGTKVGDEWENQQGEKRPGGVEHTLNKVRFVKGKDAEAPNSSPRGAQGQPQQGEPWSQSAPSAADQWNTPDSSQQVPF